MKSRKERVAVIAGISAMLLVGVLISSIKYAWTETGWVDENFWFSFRIGLGLMVLAIVYLVFGRK